MSTDLYFSLSVVSTTSVKAALEGMVYTTVKTEASDLYALAVVDRFLEDPSFPLTFHDRRYAISAILVEQVKQRLHYLCDLFQLPVPQENETYQKALEAIGEMAKMHNPELTGWCWLYYRYVRPELNISATVFSDVSFVNERTLRRYHLYAVQRLTNMLIQLEWQTRRDRRSATTSD